MHSSALRLRSCCQSRLYCHFCHIHVRRLSNAASVSVANSDQHAIESLKPSLKNGGEALIRTDKDARPIIVENLTATLEAHRAWNRDHQLRSRAPSIRKDKTPLKKKIYSHGPAPFKRVVLGADSDGGSGAEKSLEKKENTRLQMWPSDSVQAQKKARSKGLEVFVEKGKVLEYRGTEQFRMGPWKIDRSSKKMQMQRPWMGYMKIKGEDNLEQSVLESHQGTL